MQDFIAYRTCLEDIYVNMDFPCLSQGIDPRSHANPRPYSTSPAIDRFPKST